METQTGDPASYEQATPGVVRFDANGVAFTLDVSESSWLQRVYESAAAGEMPFELAVKCLTRLLGQMHAPRFMHVGMFGSYYTCYAAALLGPDSQPVSVVHHDQNGCDVIARSCTLSGLPNVRIYRAALAGLPVESATAGESGAITLDALCEREGIVGPSILHLDVEGGEGKALAGMRSVLQGIEYLLLELHDEDKLARHSGMRRSEVLRLLWDANLSVFLVAGNRPGERIRRARARGGNPSAMNDRFSYRQVTPADAPWLFFDRLTDVVLIATSRPDIVSVLGENLNDPYFCY